MAVPHYTYLVLKMPGPKGIFIVKGSFEVSDLCDKEFHKMAQNFGMIANYEEPKEKAKIATTEVDKLPEGCPAEPEMKKPRVEASGEDKTTREEEKATRA
jgi:nitrous oxide reductase accessory protein NosL